MGCPVASVCPDWTVAEIHVVIDFCSHSRQVIVVVVVVAVVVVVVSIQT